MKKTNIIFVLTLIGIVNEIAMAQPPLIAATTKCLYTKVLVPEIGGLRLGTGFNEIKRHYPGIVPMDRPPIAKGTTTYVAREPISDISLMAFIFSPENTLATYSLYYRPQKWTSLEEPTKMMFENLNLNVPKNMWDVYKNEGKDAVTVECKDVGFYTSFKDFSVNEKYFVFTVMDRSMVNRINSNPKNPTSISKERPIPSIMSRNHRIIIFPAKESEYTVEFPSSPTIRTVSSEYGTVEEATVSTVAGTLRAEYGLMTVEQRLVSQSTDDEAFRKSGLGIAGTFGYTGATVTVLRTPLGKCLKIRGYKTVGGISVLIEHYGYFGNHSIMTLITATKAAEYPTERISEFLNSIKRR